LLLPFSFMSDPDCHKGEKVNSQFSSANIVLSAVTFHILCPSNRNNKLIF
jgi:hypothetical protein